jgi:hypothetical protein
MIVILHIIIAIASIGVTTYAYVQPSASKLYTAYGLVTMTLASGMYLVVSNPSHMIQGCTAGLVYLGATSIGIVAARVKLAAVVKDNL